MEQSELLELYKNLKQGYDDGNWEIIQDAMDYLLDYIDVDEDMV